MFCRLDNLRKGTACATIQRMDWDYVGNDWAVKMLKQQAAQDSTRHAYILAGPQGIGKRTLALRFIQALNCPKAEGNGEPCLECRSCRQIEAMQFSDMQVVEMLEDKSSIIIDQIRQVQQFLSLTAYESKAKTALLVNFQNANTQAQNALLKTLEESPGSSRLIITTDAPESLLPTIVSRCEVLNLRPISAREVSTALAKRLGVEAHLAELLGHISGGRYGYARYLAEEPEVLEQRSTWLDEWVELQGMNRRQRFKYVENKLSRRLDLKKQRETLRDMIACWISYSRDILLSANGAASPPMNMDRKDEVARVAGKIKPSKAAAVIRSLEMAAERIDSYCNPRLVMETLMLEIRD